VLEARVVTGAGGGPDKTILNSARFLEPFGYRTICAYLRPPHDAAFEHLRERARHANAELVEIDDRGPCDVRVFTRLLRLCRSERVAIWHGHDYKTNLLGLVLRRFWPMRLVTTVHGWVKHTARTPLYYSLDRWSLKHYDRVVCVSDDLVQECLNSKVPRQRCSLIENAIDLEDYRRTLTVLEAKRRLGFATDRLLVGAVGRLSAEKGFDLLIDAAIRLFAEGCELDLVIAGDGDQRQKLQDKIDAAGAGARIRLLGHCSHLHELYQAMDLFVLSSHREGLPNVVLEAMAMRAPVLATRVGGVPRLIEHGESGWLVEAGDPNALQSAIRSLLDSPALRERFAEQARRTVENRHSFAARMQKFAALFDELLGRDERLAGNPVGALMGAASVAGH
jgi:glycosyltransferase involved in cell wall biosynthesis